MLKKILSGKASVTKNALYVLSRDPNHHGFTVDSRFLYELKHKVHLSKRVFGVFCFWLRLVFI